MEFSGIEVDLFRQSDNLAFKLRLQQLRLKLYSQINEIVFYGKGGYDFNTIYSMPIWLRHFIYKQMIEAYQREADASKTASDGETHTLSQAPNVRVPDYNIKRSTR